MRSLAIPLMLFGCSQPAPPVATEKLQPKAAAPTAADSRLVVRPLEPDDGEALAGELRCAFGDATGTVLLAAADVDPVDVAQAVVRDASGPRRLVAIEPGGFGALDDGGRFRGEGIEATVRPGARVDTGHEGTEATAELALTVGGGTRTLSGRWACGP